MKKIGVVLLNLGGPNNEEAVQPFLYNLFMDDDIFKIPLKGKLRSSLITFITKRRAKSVSVKYKEINACPEGCLGPKTCTNRLNNKISDCCSSTNPITEWQRRALEKYLNQQHGQVSFTVVTAMRYWYPSTDEALDNLLKAEVDEIILLPLYPQFSYTTTGSSLNEWFRRIRARHLENKWKTHVVYQYHLHPKYLEALNLRIDETLETFDSDIRHEVNLLFSAHGTPVYFEEEGDPYSKQIKETIKAVVSLRKNDYHHWHSYQSRVGPVKWLKPNTEDFLKVLHGYGIEQLLVIPIAFVSDHIETLHEIGIEFKEVAEELGIKGFQHTTGLNDSPTFIECLADLVEKQIDSENISQAETLNTIIN